MGGGEGEVEEALQFARRGYVNIYRCEDTE